MKNFLKKNIVFIAICIASVSISLNRISEFKAERVLFSDVLEYYIYFPSYFIYCEGDLTTIAENADTWQYSWARKSETGKPVFKFTLGVSLLASPFYILAHEYCMLNDHYAANGFEKPYIVAMLFATVFYLLLGLFFLRKVLVLYFKPLVADIVILLLFGATNMAFYSFFLIGMSHTFSLAVISMYFYYTIKWHETKTTRYLIFIGLLVGFIFLIRPVNILFAVFFILYGCKNLKDVLNKFISLVKDRRFYLLPAAAIIVAFPQFLYWKMQTGSWYFYSYFDEGFFFRDPKLIEVFLSFRSGLLIYSPVMIFAIVGLFMVKKRLNDYFLTVLVTFFVFTYVVSSWWCWWYVGFGHRAFIDLFPLLAIPFAISVEKILEWKWWYKGPVALIVAMMVYLSVFQTLQYSRGKLHFDGMNQKSYCLSFLNMNPGIEYYESLKSPDYSKANQGFRDIMNYDNYFDFEVNNTNGFEFLGNWTYCAPRHQGFAHGGEFSQLLDTVNVFSASYCAKLGDMFNETPDSIAIYTWFNPLDDVNSSMFIFNILNGDSSMFYESRPVAAGKVQKNVWQFSRIVIPWPGVTTDEQNLKLYLWNPGKGRVFVDDFGFSLIF